MVDFQHKREFLADLGLLEIASVAINSGQDGWSVLQGRTRP
jgi:hypothetical protein